MCNAYVRLQNLTDFLSCGLAFLDKFLYLCTTNLLNVNFKNPTYMKEIFTCFSPSFFRKISLKFLTILLLLLAAIQLIAADKTDNIVVEDLAATSTTYTNFSNTSKTSSAKYAGQSAKGNSVIQLKSENPVGLVSTTSGGAIKSVTITWDSNTESGRTIDVYGKNSAYTNAGDLYNNATSGVKLGSIVYGTSTSLTIVGDFKYIGLRSNNKTLYVSQISITWTDEDDPLDYEYNLVTDVSDLSAGDRVIILNTEGTYALSATQNTNNRAGVAAAENNWSISGSTVTLGASTTVEVMTIGVQNSHKVFVTSTGYLRGAGNSSNYYLKTSTSLPDSYCEWAISLNGSNEASIVGCGDNTNKTMQFNSNVFACYADASHTAIKIYKQEPPSYTVTWSAGNEPSFSTQTDVAGTALDDPGTPTASTYCPGGKVFVGWTATEDYSDDDDPPTDLFTSVSGKSIPVDGITYYAVYATESEGGGTEYVFTDYDEVTAGTYVIASYNTTTSKYVALTGGIVTISSYKDLENETTGFTLTNNKFTTLPTGACEFTLAGNSSDGFTIKNGETNGYLGYTAQGTSRRLDFGSDYSSYTWKVASETESGYPDGCYIHRGLDLNYTISTNSNNTSSQVRGYSGNTAYKPMYFFKKGSAVSYSAYETECAPTCADPTAAGHGTINMTTQKMPITWTTAADNVDICYSTNSEKPGSTPGEGYTVKSGITASTEIDSLDISGLSAGNYYTWVRSVCDESSKSNWVAITDNYFTVPGHTLTISPSPASSGSFSPTSGQTVVEQRSVAITATPAAGYTFTSWAVSGTGSMLSSTTDNPTTFTMGTADATVTATFSEKTVTGWTWTNHRGGATITSDAIVVYVGQKVQLDIAYLPADVLSSHTAASNYSYDRSDGDSYLKYESKASGYFRFSGKAAKSSTSISFTHSEDTSSPKEFVKTVNVEVRALPTDTYLDLVHGISFSGPYGASLIDSDYGVQFTYTAPGGDVSDWSSTYANTCEQYHVHLIGWVESTWADEHLGDAEMPNTAAITSSGYYYPVGETMTVSGKTYYAVWAKVE